jgi:small subunit ribosomal protein S20
MPIIKSAKKRVRSSERKHTANLEHKKKMKTAVKAAGTTKTAEALGKAYQALDRAAKRGVIHRNKAARTKSRLANKLAS